MKKALLLLAFVLCSFYVFADYQDIDDTKVYFNASPANMQGPGWVYLQFTSKQYTGNIHFGIGVNGDYLSLRELQRYNPHEVNTTYSVTCESGALYENNSFSCYYGPYYIEREYDYYEGLTFYFTETNIEDYQKLNLDSTIVNYEYDNKNKWYVLKNIPVTAGTTYNVRFWVDAPFIPLGSTQQEAFPDYDGKYDIFFYPSSYNNNVATAISNNHFYFLDPGVNLTNGLTDYWDCDGVTEGENRADHTKNMTANGAIGCDTGKIGLGYEANNSNTNFWSGNESNLRPSNWVRTLCYWYKPREVTSQAYSHMFNYGDNFASQAFGHYRNLGIPTFYGQSNDDPFNSGTFQANEWDFICTSYNGTHIFNWFNATLVDDGVAKTLNTVGGDFRVGLDAAEASNTYMGNGIIDSIGMWNKVLNQTEIEYLYNDSYGVPFEHLDSNIPEEVNATACEPTGSTNWELSESCSITSAQDVGGYNIITSGYDLTTTVTISNINRIEATGGSKITIKGGLLN